MEYPNNNLPPTIEAVTCRKVKKFFVRFLRLNILIYGQRRGVKPAAASGPPAERDYRISATKITIIINK